MDISYNSYEILTSSIFYNSSQILQLIMINNRLRKVERLVNMPNLYKLDLSENHITTVPDGIFNDSLQIVELYLSRNFICCIEGLRVLSKLRTLNLNYNRIYNIPHHVLRNLTSLETLSIAYNFISNLNGLPDNIFLISLICGGNGIKSLNFKQPIFKEVSYVINVDHSHLGHVNISDIKVESLYLSNCSIFRIYALNRLEHLRYIFLSNNYITRISADAVYDLPDVYSIVIKYNFIKQFPMLHLPSLRFLSLTGNKIRNITKDHLHSLPNLRDLHVGYNLIERLSELSHENLVKLDLQGNAIYYVSSITADNFPKLLFLILKGNRVLSLSDVTGALTIPYLYLTNNQIGDISENELLLQTNWLELQLSDNKLTKANFSLPATIRAVFLKNNCIDHVVIGSFNPHIQSLFLSRNRVSSLSFTNFFPNLVSFDLSENLITQVTRDDFRTTSALSEINLSRNHIYFIETHVLTKMRDLQMLNLSNNRLSTLGESTFPHTSLHHLSLRVNNLSTMPQNVFRGVPKELRYLQLSDNSLSDISSLLLGLSRTLIFLNLTNFSQDKQIVFSGLHNVEFTQLRILDMSSLDISRARGLYPINAPLLRSMRLDFNNFEMIPSTIFRNVSDIENVFLIGNHIRYVRKNDFKTVEKLYLIISLEKNYITHIERGAFTYTSKLRILNLRHNYIKQVSYDFFLALLIQSNGFGLDDNPWDCTCEMRWVQSELLSAKGGTQVKCASPSYMSNRSIADDELDCPPALCNHGNGLPTDQVVVALVRKPFQILCPVVLDNVDTIEWIIGLQSNSSLSNMSISAPEAYSVSEGSSRESESFIFLVYNTSDYLDIQCSAVNRVGTTVIDIGMKVCDSFSVLDCKGNGSITVAEWNDQVTRKCSQPSVPTLTAVTTSTSTSTTGPRMVTSRVELSYSKVHVLTFAIPIALSGIEFP